MPERGQARNLDRRAGQGGDGQGPSRRVALRVEGSQVGDELDEGRQHGGGDDADEDRALHLAHVQDEHEEQAEEEDEHGPALEGPAQPQLQRSAGGATHHFGVHQSDESDEQADPDADRGLDVSGNGLEDGLAETGEDQDEDDDALDDDQPHGIGVGHAAHAHERVGDHRVDAEPRRQGHRVVGHHAHEDRHDSGDQGCAGGDLLGGAQRRDAVVRGGQDERVQHEDVGHREEGDDTAADLAGECGAALADVEEGVQGGAAGGRLLGGRGLCIHDTILPDATGWARAKPVTRMSRSGRDPAAAVRSGLNRSRPVSRRPRAGLACAGHSRPPCRVRGPARRTGRASGVVGGWSHEDPPD